MTQPRLLWIDDDGSRRRFRYEEAVLSKTWFIAWAHSVYGAAETLSTSEYQAILLDQSLPFKNQPQTDIWGGCALLWWLTKPGESLAVIPRAQLYEELNALTPLAKNRVAKVCVVSAYDDEGVAAQMRAARPDLVVRPKPIDLDALRRFLETVARGED
jgi:DNA-binding NarL/FixJ family response regulator